MVQRLVGLWGLALIAIGIVVFTVRGIQVGGLPRLPKQADDDSQPTPNPVWCTRMWLGIVVAAVGAGELLGHLPTP